MSANVGYKLFQCSNCNAIDCLKIFKGDNIHTLDERFNPIMNCFNCHGNDTMQFVREITSDEHEIMFRGKQSDSTEQPENQITETT